MNLVAKEYVACKPEGDGVLVLSEFAGAAAEMGEALLINPFDEQRTESTIKRALALDEPERRMRMRMLHRRVLRNNVFRWGERFLAALQEAVLNRGTLEWRRTSATTVERSPRCLRSREPPLAGSRLRRNSGSICEMAAACSPSSGALGSSQCAGRRTQESRGAGVGQIGGRLGGLVRQGARIVAGGRAWSRVETSIRIRVGIVEFASAARMEVYRHADSGALRGPHAGEFC